MKHDPGQIDATILASCTQRLLSCAWLTSAGNAVLVDLHQLCAISPSQVVQTNLCHTFSAMASGTTATDGTAEGDYQAMWANKYRGVCGPSRRA